MSLSSVLQEQSRPPVTMTSRQHGRFQSPRVRRYRNDGTAPYAFYYQQDKHRLFICYNSIQATELRNMCGRKLRRIDLIDVEIERAKGKGFKEEINLAVPR